MADAKHVELITDLMEQNKSLQEMVTKLTDDATSREACANNGQENGKGSGHAYNSLTQSSASVMQTGLKISELLKNPDLDGDGVVDEKDAELASMLKGMDMDGDGSVSIAELIHSARAVKIEKKESAAKITKLKKALVLVVLAAIAIMGLLLALMIAANEATKDTKPTSSGVLETIDGNPVTTSTTKTQLPLASLEHMSLTTLDQLDQIKIKLPDSLASYLVSGYKKYDDGKLHVYTDHGVTVMLEAGYVSAVDRYDKEMPLVLPKRRLLSELASESDESVTVNGEATDITVEDIAAKAPTTAVPTVAAPTVAAPTVGGMGQLQVAAQNGRVDEVIALLKTDIDVNMQDEWGYTALHHATKEGHADVVEALLQNAPSIDVNLSADRYEDPRYAAVVTTDEGGTAFQFAAVFGHLDVVEAFLKNSDYSIMNTHVDQYYRTSLHLAAYFGHADVVNALLLADSKYPALYCSDWNPQNCNVNAGDAWGYTALHLAAVTGHADVVNALLKNSVALLVNRQDKDGDPDAPWDAKGWSALHLAVQYGNADVVSALLKNATDLHVNDGDYEQRTALHFAVLYQYAPLGVSILDALLHAPGIDVDHKDCQGRDCDYIDWCDEPCERTRTALDYAYAYPRDDKAIQLLCAFTKDEKHKCPVTLIQR